MTGLLTELQNDLVWLKGREASGRDPAEWRTDDYGFLMRRADHGNRNSIYGWEKDHYPTPKALGGSDHIDNLRPLSCRANAVHGGLLGAALKDLVPPPVLPTKVVP